jgi:hypothetical protein
VSFRTFLADPPVLTQLHCNSNIVQSRSIFLLIRCNVLYDYIGIYYCSYIATVIYDYRRADVVMLNSKCIHGWCRVGHFFYLYFPQFQMDPWLFNKTKLGVFGCGTARIGTSSLVSPIFEI